MHYTEGLVTADVVTIPVHNELKVHIHLKKCIEFFLCQVYRNEP